MLALEQSVLAHQRLLEQGASLIVQAADMISACLKNGCKVMFCGNGGSAADAQHAAAELVGRFYLDRPALSALSLSTDTSVLTAVGNDWEFEDVFARQVMGLGRAGDVLVGLSTSGRSKNIVRAFEAARSLQIKTLLLSGETDGPASRLSDLSIQVPSTATPRIQELHITALHTICELVECAMLPADQF